MSNSAAITKTGTGTWNPSNTANTYTGAVAVNVGIVNAASTTSFGTTAGGVTVANNAAITLSAAVGAEALTLNGNGATGTAGALESTATSSWAGAITLASDSTVATDAATTLTLSGAIGETGSRALTKAGTGTLVLSGCQQLHGHDQHQRRHRQRADATGWARPQRARPWRTTRPCRSRATSPSVTRT